MRLRRRCLRRPLTVARLPFHQVGQPPAPRYLWPRAHVFQPPLFALGMSIHLSADRPWCSLTARQQQARAR